MSNELIKSLINLDELYQKTDEEVQQGSLILERKPAKFNPMIKLRTDFDDLMEDSVEEIK